MTFVKGAWQGDQRIQLNLQANDVKFLNNPFPLERHGQWQPNGLQRETRLIHFDSNIRQEISTCVLRYKSNKLIGIVKRPSFITYWQMVIVKWLIQKYKSHTPSSPFFLSKSFLEVKKINNLFIDKFKLLRHSNINTSSNLFTRIRTIKVSCVTQTDPLFPAVQPKFPLLVIANRLRRFNYQSLPLAKV